jgi:LAS superfamily LD-carboxypeptidase LdcB
MAVEDRAPRRLLITPEMSRHAPELEEVPSLVGQTEDHLCSPEIIETLGVPVHRDVVGRFQALQADAGEAGFDLRILSGFRSFDQQLSIWNRKVDGELAVLDSDAVPLDIRGLTERELVFAILRWSALPGASRHHWGTDLDVFDAVSRPEEYEIELIPEEVESGGMFGPLHDWLDERIENSDSQGFFRPYDRDRGGVAPERWHLSCGPVADAYMARLSVDLLRATVRNSDLGLKEVVLEHLDEIYDRFVLNTGRPPR